LAAAQTKLQVVVSNRCSVAHTDPHNYLCVTIGCCVAEALKRRRAQRDERSLSEAASLESDSAVKAAQAEHTRAGIPLVVAQTEKVKADTKLSVANAYKVKKDADRPAPPAGPPAGGPAGPPAANHGAGSSVGGAER
jgi:hypothetical protein